MQPRNQRVASNSDRNVAASNNPLISSLLNKTKSVKLADSSKTNTELRHSDTIKTRSANAFVPGNGADLNRLAPLTSGYLSDSQRLTSAKISASEVIIEKLSDLKTKLVNPDGAYKLHTLSNAITKQLNHYSSQPNDVTDGTLKQTFRPLVKQLQADLSSLSSAHVAVEEELKTEIQVTNNLLARLVKLNEQAQSSSAAGDPSLFNKSEQQTVLGQLTKKLSFKVVEKTGGSIDLQINGGFTLVSGTSFKKLELKKDGDTNTQNANQKAASGHSPSQIIYDFSLGQGSGQINLTDRLISGAGSIGALLTLQGTPVNGATETKQTPGVLAELSDRLSNLTGGLQKIANFIQLEQKAPSDGNSSASRLSQINKLWRAPLDNESVKTYSLQGDFVDHSYNIAQHLDHLLQNSQMTLNISQANQTISKLRQEQLANGSLAVQMNSIQTAKDTYQQSIKVIDNAVALIDNVAASI